MQEKGRGKGKEKGGQRMKEESCDEEQGSWSHLNKGWGEYENERQANMDRHWWYPDQQSRLEETPDNEDANCIVM